MRYLLSLSLICLLSCSAFKKKDNPKIVDLKSTSWAIVSMADFELEKTHQPITMEFNNDNLVGGSTGCNSYGGSYMQKGAQLSFVRLIGTKMACIPGMQTEIQFFEVLEQTNQFEIKKNYLILKNGATILATFSRVRK